MVNKNIYNGKCYEFGVHFCSLILIRILTAYIAKYGILFEFANNIPNSFLFENTIQLYIKNKAANLNV